VDNTEEFRCISLCTGYAGIELGLKRAVPTMRTVAYVEIEAFAVANLVAKMEAGKLDAAPVWTDIKTFDGRAFSKRVHIVTAGYPCQSESHAGKRKGKADPRWLWPYIERIIEAVKPVWFFGENVSGHLTIGYPEVYRSLRDMGYSVEAGLFSAAECGAPHKRERLFILAHDTSIGRSTWWAESEGQCGQTCIARSGELANPQRLGRRGRDNGEPAGQGRPLQTEGPGQLADTTAQRIQGDEPEGITQAGGQIEQHGWPSRPGQPQYEWEEPRVVGNAEKYNRGKTKRRVSAKTERKSRTERFEDRSGQGQAQSRLGRAVDGTNCRVDRLRLLGNGVVPQQAEKALRYLIKKFE